MLMRIMDSQLKNLPQINQTLSTSSLKQYTFYIVILAVVMVELVVGGYLTSQFWASISSSNATLTQLGSETQQAEQMADNLDQLDEGKLKSQLAAAAVALPTEKKVSGIISSLTSLASSSGVVVNQLELTPCNISTRSAVIKVQNVSKSDCENVQLQNGISGIPLTMQVIAEENQLQAFVQKLFKTSPMLGLRHLTYTYSAKGKVADLSLLLYFQPLVTTQDKSDNLSPLSPKDEEVLSGLNQRIVILP